MMMRSWYNLRLHKGGQLKAQAGAIAAAVVTRDRSELGELAEAFNQMAATLSLQREEVQQQQATLAERNQALESTLAELQTNVAAREQLARTVRLLSMPMVPLLAQVIMIPLVGEIDLGRAKLLLDRLLEGITEQRARIAILDITGVPVVDSALVGWLLKAAASARLLGAQCIRVGIGPEVAQAIVASGADLTELATRADLRDAVEYAMQTVRR
jgi:rsbT co-antagonist protein RsbR